MSKKIRFRRWYSDDVYKTTFPDAIVLAAYFSLGGFTQEAGDFCLKYGIGVAEKIEEL